VLLRIGLLCVGLPGCTSFGPNRLESDQLQYARAISDSQKRQTLLNIVRLRYADTPTFFSANQVISSYTLDRRAELGLNVYPNARGGNFATGLGGVTFSDHPTVTFAPLSGEQLARTAVRPLSPTDLLQFAQDSLPVDVVFRLGVQSIGQLRNTVILGGEEGAGLPQQQFFELLVGMRRLQVAGLLTVRFVHRKDGNHVYLGITDGNDQELQATVVRVRRLLGMTPGQTEAEVVYGRVPSGPHQIAILTRPMIGVFSQVSSEVEVPPADVAAGRTVSSVSLVPYGLKPIITVHSGRAEPSDAATAVKYHGSWFWIDGNDFNSKVAFTILGLLISVMQGTAGQVPILTIPAG